MRSGLVASFLAGIVLILLTAFTGDADAIDPWNVQEQASIPAGGLSGANVIGQTFVSHYDRLHSIQVLAIASDDLEYPRDSYVTLYVRQRSNSLSDLATAFVPMSAFAQNHWVKFNFPPIENSRDQSFYFFLDVSQAQITRGHISVWSSSDDVYADGTLDINGVAANRDLVFRPYYEPDAWFLFGALIRLLTKYSAAIILVLLACLVFSLVIVSLISNYQSLITNLQSPILLIIIALAVIAFAVNLLQIRDTPVPLWKDSPVHAEFISQILSTGQIPTGPFYHFGFHALAVFLVKFSGIGIPQMMLVLGQILLTMTGLTTWLVVKRLTSNHTAAMTSAVCVWFLSPTPAYFVTWGRYPLILGGALLPLALYFGIEWLEQSRWNTKLFLIALVTFLGMAFSHVRLSAFYLIFIVIYLMGWLIQHPNKERVLPTIVRVGVLALLETLIVFLWIHSQAPPTGTSSMPSAVSSAALGTDVAMDVLLSHHGRMLIALSCIGIIFALGRRNRFVFITTAWFIALYAFSSLPPTWLGGEYLSPAFVLLMAFLPMSFIVGELIAFVYTKTTVQSNKAVVVWSVTLSIIVLLGARDMIALVNPATIIFSDADQNAMEWILQNTPRDTKFLINSDEWFASSFSPSDGGWWIPHVTGRRIDWLTSAADASTVSQRMSDQNIEWIYLGWRGGMLRKLDFICQPTRYALRYSQNGVAIFQVRQPNEPIMPLPDFCAGD